jgi:NAD(P)-dependent dehydrogenase (short-subunit alcohol dehydrogenase family)
MTALVTGAGAGIGRETALACARRGAKLVICDLDEARLVETESEIRELGRGVLARRVDVGSKAQMGAFADLVHGEYGAVDLLVNNAGVGLGALFLETSLEDWEWITRVNLFGVIHGCHFFVPEMVRRQRRGHVVNIASAAAYAPLPAQSAYAAAKFAVLGLSECLRTELAPFGIGVTAACPGFINTTIVETSRLRGVAAAPETRRRTIAFYRRRNYSAARVATNILAAVQRNRAVAPISPEAWVMYYAMRWIPSLLRRANRRLGARIAISDQGREVSPDRAGRGPTPAASLLRLLAGGIPALLDVGEELERLAPGLVGREYAIAPDRAGCDRGTTGGADGGLTDPRAPDPNARGRVRPDALDQPGRVAQIHLASLVGRADPSREARPWPGAAGGAGDRRARGAFEALRR